MSRLIKSWWNKCVRIFVSLDKIVKCLSMYKLSTLIEKTCVLCDGCNYGSLVYSRALFRLSCSTRSCLYPNPVNAFYLSVQWVRISSLARWADSFSFNSSLPKFHQRVDGAMWIRYQIDCSVVFNTACWVDFMCVYWEKFTRKKRHWSLLHAPLPSRKGTF